MFSTTNREIEETLIEIQTSTITQARMEEANHRKTKPSFGFTRNGYEGWEGSMFKCMT